MADPFVSCHAASITYAASLTTWSHIPSDDNYRAVQAAQASLDTRLEQLWASLDEQQRQAVEARAVRVLAVA